MGFTDEFRQFAVRGNVVDMAVGVIIGGAFGKIVTSLVNDLVMPPIGVLTGGVNFNQLKFVLKEAVGNQPAVTINYGTFVQTIVDFSVVSFSVFIVVKVINSFHRQEAERKAAEEEAAKP